METLLQIIPFPVLVGLIIFLCFSAYVGIGAFVAHKMCEETGVYTWRDETDQKITYTLIVIFWVGVLTGYLSYKLVEIIWETASRKEAWAFIGSIVLLGFLFKSNRDG